MAQVNYKQIKAVEQRNKNKWLAVNSYLTDNSGIYILTRTDENGIRYAYIGQAKHVLTRLAQHLTGYQHIDLSLKKHGLWSKENTTGWFVSAQYCDENILDVDEQYYIKKYADLGFQLRNKTLGGQGQGKVGIAENKPPKGYYDGKKQGRKDLAKELKAIITHLTIVPKDKGKRAHNAMDKFIRLLVMDEEICREQEDE